MKETDAKALRRHIFTREVHPDSGAKRQAQSDIDALAPNSRKGRRAYQLALRKADKLRQRVEKGGRINVREVLDAR